ncbi:MAG: cobyrinic acid a,c-diamide synthase [Methanocella sp. PtaU1.Bin125]|nr:MAG: cobyrinic acid a,c-diamide synthase [Methanocella sp. PtaU1.Bin125]
MDIPRICIAGTHSGCGKTTIATGLMAALAAQGLKVQPFKVGPDFIDPTHHSAICGRTSRNLDAFMMGEDGVAETFARACRGADIAVVEGVMGLYDGLEGTETASTAHVAKLLSAPVVLTVDASAMTRSANALVRGFREFDPGVDVTGVIFNRIGSPSHRRMIEASLEAEPLGWMPRKAGLAVKSRHLGLNMAQEDDRLKGAGEAVREHCDLQRIIDVARSAPPLPDVAVPEAPAGDQVSVGIAMDDAFCFYYRDNLDRLAEAGARLVFFSPMDDRLPEVDALYLGGGYPELHAAKLEAAACRDQIKKAIDDGMPAYGECGGLMYLAESVAAAGTEYRMAGVMPAKAVMTDKMQALGYIKAAFVQGPVFEPGLAYRGHEFHYSRVECGAEARFAVRTESGKGIAGGLDGIYEHNAIGAYTHAYFTNDFARSFVDAAGKYSRL